MFIPGLLVDWTIDQRYVLFKWLLAFTKNAHVAPTNPAEQKEAELRTKVVRKHCAIALKHLVGLGKTVPDEHVATLLKDDLLKSLLELDSADG